MCMILEKPGNILRQFYARSEYKNARVMTILHGVYYSEKTNQLAKSCKIRSDFRKNFVLSAKPLRLYVIIMSSTSFRVNHTL